MRQRRHNRTAGFSLIEVVVGIALLGLVTAPVCASLLLSVRLNSYSQALMQAQLQTASVAETLLAEGINIAAKDGEDAVWDGNAEDGWTRKLDGVELTVTAVSGKPYYEVSLSSGFGVEGNEETVVVKTRVRDVTPPEPEGGDGT